ncbi:ADP-ribose pyrophosphatase YjhB (NUDIX family) [Kushneria sinocarnis]|uniref:ADP-ribose pyrophosphatase YjhB (NUDIX family) n=1 Tax=Kushneria sinocarnis TaxID=595502 RepID=A0A420WX36_9GAMM|nr:NUDIX hydrolase [Kushneria sinocarnis]RKR04278.1 ADP-ribose pyrophosphatase YjhB (NUDIX family) [Kushneria sinocarnis]
MNFCSHCGAPVRLTIPAGDDRLRYLCERCGTIHYQNPRIVAGTLPLVDDRVLLCRRAIAPRQGYWTLPAGFMENGETTEQAARRETLEEACAELAELSLYTLIDLPHIHQVYMIFLGRLAGDFSPGPESHEVRLFEEAEIPWEALAFPTIERTLKHYFDDRCRELPPGAVRYALHVGSFERWQAPARPD